ncbi:MAG: dipeptidase [Candidatus Hydrogenedentota bacterium]
MNLQLVFDGHNDWLLRMREHGDTPQSFFDRLQGYHLDFPRARESGLAGGIFAMFTPASLGPNDDLAGPADNASRDVPLPAPIERHWATDNVFAMVRAAHRIEALSEGRVRIVRNVIGLDAAFAEGVFSIVLHIEGAEAIDTELDALYVLYEAGLRSLGIVWSRPNDFGHGVPFRFPSSPDTGPGLTEAGGRLVRACNELGVVIDLSHITQRGFWDVAKESTAPLVASHSCAHAICPSARNLTDAQIDAVRDTGGIIGVNFHVGFLRSDGRRDANTPLSEIVRHVRYIADRTGVDHVGLGSDFDGATMPGELGGVEGLPRLIAALRLGGFDESDLEKIAWRNWRRVIGATWKG